MSAPNAPSVPALPAHGRTDVEHVLADAYFRRAVADAAKYGEVPEAVVYSDLQCAVQDGLAELAATGWLISRYDDTSDYEFVRDVAIELFNPPDDDVAEPDIVNRALRDAADLIAELPCTCSEPVEDYDTCRRCRVLGRHFDVLVER
jgi:hypothetical protein